MQGGGLQGVRCGGELKGLGWVGVGFVPWTLRGGVCAIAHLAHEQALAQSAPRSTPPRLAAPPLLLLCNCSAIALLLLCTCNKEPGPAKGRGSRRELPPRTPGAWSMEKAGEERSYPRRRPHPIEPLSGRLSPAIPRTMRCPSHRRPSLTGPHRAREREERRERRRGARRGRREGPNDSGRGRTRTPHPHPHLPLARGRGYPYTVPHAPPRHTPTPPRKTPFQPPRTPFTLWETPLPPFSI